LIRVHSDAVPCLHAASPLSSGRPSMKLPANFTHLHVHSHYSLMGATPTLPELVSLARKDGLNHLALTDTNALFGAVAFARECRAHGIRPIIGMAVTMAPPPEEMWPDQLGSLGTLVLLATNPQGYRSLCRLSSILQADKDRDFRRRNGLQWQELRDTHEGLWCLTGGRTGWLEQAIRDGREKAARRYVARIGGIFGEKCALSLSADLLRPEMKSHAAEMMSLGSRFGIQLAAVQPIYVTEPEKRPTLRLMAAVKNNCHIEGVPDGALPDRGDESVSLHWPLPEEMADAFAPYPELLAVAGEIADSCGDVLPDARLLWPSLPVKFGLSVEAAFHKAAEEGLAERYGDRVPAGAGERLAREIDAILDFGSAPLFLIIADVVRFARRHDIPVSTRGSVANSLVAYCLGITTVDPISNDLLFERFLSPARRSPPDIDLDFCSRRRDQVLDYIRITYGEDRVALISTMNTFRPRSAVRETGKAYGIPEIEIGKMIAALPRGWHPDPRRRSQDSIDALLLAIENDRHREIIRQAYELVGRPAHPGLHPGGVVITPGPLSDTVPLLFTAKGFLATQYDHGDVEAIGLPKLDLLGIRALTVLADATLLVKQYHDPEFHLDNIPSDDLLTGDMVARGATVGVFQCESDGARRTLRQLQARNVADLAVAGAFFKPGPAMGGMARTFVRRYRGEEPVAYLHPSLEPILAHTKGVLLFQEQVLRVATEIAGLSWEQADRLRTGMSKFQASEMDALAADFIAGCRRPAPEGPGYSQDQANVLWDQIIAFAGYGFNQGHATAYADVSYRSAYIKAHWPAEFMCARLADAGGFHHPAIYMAEARQLGIATRPPQVNFSGKHFTLTYEPDSDGIERPTLWMGLDQVGDLRRSTIKAIISAVTDSPFTSVHDLLERISLQSKETDHLIRCGALDGLGSSRQTMLADAGLVERAGSIHQMAFNFLDSVEPVETVGQRIDWETEILGQPVSANPLELVEEVGDQVGFDRLPASSGRSVSIRAYRLPGWTGGSGYFVSNGKSYIHMRMSRDDESARVGRLPVWRPLQLTGRWVTDKWQGNWFQADAVETLPVIN
jgi:DNA polymerase III subunit alpha